jgi:predicted glutamine amidotransferase
MCRMMGLLAPRPASAEHWLLETDHSLLRQSNGAPRSLQADGWGIAWSDQGGVQAVRGTGPVFEVGEVDRFREGAHRARAPMIIGHVRKASNPMDLDHGRLIMPENIQPFVSGSTVFVHNGTVPFPTETRSKLGPYQGSVRGLNDSEVLFWLLMRHLDETKDPVSAYARTVGDLIDVWRAEGAPPKGPYTGLNILLSRHPGELWAFCQFRGEHGTALLDPHRRYFDFAYADDGKTFLVGSEPLDSTRTDWKDLGTGQWLQARASREAVTVRTGTIPLPPEVPVPVGGPGRASARYGLS